MQPAHELVIKLLKTPVADSPMEDVSSEETLLPRSMTMKHMELTLRLAATLVGVRKGQRLPTSVDDKATALQSYMMALQGLTQHISSSAEGFKREYLKALTATLIAGKVKDWLSPGISLIKATWAALELREKLAWVRVLVRVGWKGVEQFLLADVAR
jgi:U3 small nucleolar RNA-associated protein 20